ncbi:MAG: hypothetical protein P8Z50_08410, partial [candidate division WOR-3 bacterium]
KLAEEKAKSIKEGKGKKEAKTDKIAGEKAEQKKEEEEVELIHPIAMEEELRFAVREGGRTVGAGVVTAIEE